MCRRYYTKRNIAGPQATHIAGPVGWVSLSVGKGTHLENHNSLKLENKSKGKTLNVIKVDSNGSPVINA
jgi:hypothetical protein